MPYNTIISNKFTPDHALGMWELRISILPYTQEDGYKQIRTIIANIAQKYDINAKIWKITGANDLLNYYDGATSHLGKDRTQRGKDVCLQFPDAAFCSFSTNEYKRMILDIWKALQDQDISLVYMNIPGDMKVPGPGSLPTPFSISSTYPKTLPREWDNPHGILFKQFRPFEDNHPLCGIKITKEDLCAHGIAFNAAENFDLSHHYYDQHQKIAFEHLQTDITNYLEQELDYKTVLMDDDLVAFMKQALAEYNKAIALVDVSGRARFRERFNHYFLSNKGISLLLNGYPHEEGPQFLEHPAITQLRNLSNLNSDQEIDYLIHALRTHYSENSDLIASTLKTYFAFHTAGDDNSLESIRIDWKDYFEDYSLDLLDTLIAQNPAGAQTLYRRIICLELERRAQFALLEQYDNLSPIGLSLFSTDKKTVAVLDADSTLIMAQDSSTGLTTLNENLLSSLTSSGINEVFLCTNMNFHRKVVLERMALIDALKTKGIRVLGVATSVDCVWKNPDDQLIELSQKFYEENGCSIPFESLCDQLTNGALSIDSVEFYTSEVGHVFNKASSLYAEDYKAYKRFQEDNQYKSDLLLGVSEYVDRTIDSDRLSEKEALFNKAKHCKIINKLYSHTKGITHSKGLLFNALINHHNHCKSLLYFDTNKQRIAAVNDCKESLAGLRLISTVPVHSSHIDTLENYLDRIKEHQDQIEFISPMAKLSTACSSFLDKFQIDSQYEEEDEEDVNYELQSQFEAALSTLCKDLANDINQKIKAGIRYDTLLKTPAIKIIDSTINMLHALDKELSNRCSSNELKKRNIQRIMKQYKKCTQDSGGLQFMKAVAVVIATALGFVLGALIGAGIGMAAGSWTGLGAAATGVMGLFYGAQQGTSIGLLAGASITGLLTGGITQYGLFKKSPFIKTMIADVSNIIDTADEHTAHVSMYN